MFVCIQNPGVAPVEGFTLLGVSTTRDCGVEGTVGQFGSGNKHAINVLLAGRPQGLRLLRQDPPGLPDPGRRDRRRPDPQAGQAGHVQDGRHVHADHRPGLGARLRGDRLDRPGHGTARVHQQRHRPDRPRRERRVHPRFARRPAGRHPGLEDEKVKAKDGYTRVYVELNANVQRYIDELPKRFLHFSDRPEQVSQSFLPKADRNLNGNQHGRDLPGRRLRPRNRRDQR